MKKVVCIKQGDYWLTVGKTYNVWDLADGFIHDYQIMNDRGVTHYVEKSLFVPLADVREKRLNILLNENQN
jgi:hypothetical protein